MPKLYLRSWMNNHGGESLLCAAAHLKVQKWKPRYLLINGLFSLCFSDCVPTELTLLTNCPGASDNRYPTWLRAIGSSNCVASVSFWLACVIQVWGAANWDPKKGIFIRCKLFRSLYRSVLFWKVFFLLTFQTRLGPEKLRLSRCALALTNNLTSLDWVFADQLVRSHSQGVEYQHFVAAGDTCYIYMSRIGFQIPRV